jgi:hypothetical protein
MKSSFAFAFAIAVFALGSAVFGAQGTTSPYSDPTGDIDAGISTGNGTLDITGMEVTNTATDINFKLTVNGDVSTTDWGKFMIGIASYKNAGTISGNGWGRPINMSVTPTGAGSPIGMDYWIGSWVDGGGGAQLWSYDGAAWTGPGSLGSFSFTPGATSEVNYSVPMATLGLAGGDSFSFDAYSSGGGGGDTAIDALSNPNVSVTSWGQSYTSQPLAFSGPGLNSYTITAVPEPATMAAFGVVGAAVAGRLMRRRSRNV